MFPRGDGSRADSIMLAKLSEQAERYADMLEYLKAAIAIDPDLTVEEHNLFSCCYQNLIGSLLASLRVSLSLERKEKREQEATRVCGYREKVEAELRALISDLLSLIAVMLGANIRDELRIYLLKMKADYSRYQAEFSAEQERTLWTQLTDTRYRAAYDYCRALRDPWDPYRLGIALNYSVFLYEIGTRELDACQMISRAFSEAIRELGSLPTEQYKDATVIMSLLRDNLTLWTGDWDCEGLTSVAKKIP